MGRKSRGKKYKKFAKVSPDESFSLGPISIERYGRVVRMSNQMSEEEHKEFVQSMEGSRAALDIQIEQKIAQLQELVKNVDALELLHRAAYELISIFMGIKSKTDLTHDDTLVLPAVEFIQFVLAMNGSTQRDELSDEDYKKILNLAQEIILQTRDWLSASKPDSENIEISRLRHWLLLQKLGIRYRRHVIFQKRHWRNSFLPYDKFLQKNYGISAESLIAELNKILSYTQSGIPKRYESLVDAQKVFIDRLSDAHIDLPVGADGNIDVEKFKRIATPELLVAYQECEEKVKDALTVEIFNISKICNIPRELMQLFSVRVGQENIEGPHKPDNSMALTPLSGSPVHLKPFVEMDGKFYYFMHSGFEDELTHILERSIPDGPAKSKISQLRHDLLLKEVAELLTDILAPDFCEINLFYPDPEKQDSRPEMDILIKVDDILLIVECKAGYFNEAASRSYDELLKNNLTKEIVDGHAQAARAQEYIQKEKSAPFFHKRSNEPIININSHEIKKIHRIVVTREALGWAGAKLAGLAGINADFIKDPSLHISIDDLYVVHDIFKGKPANFLHYLGERKLAGLNPMLESHDELDHLALYLAHNVYHETPAEDINAFTFTGYTSSLDEYFREKYIGENTPSTPSQDMPRLLGEILGYLNTCKLKYRFEVAELLLGLGGESRDKLSKELENAKLKEVNEGKKLSIRMPFSDWNSGITLTLVADSLFDRELARSAAIAKQANVDDWIVIRFQSLSPIRILEISHPDFSRIPLERLAVAEDKTNELVDELIQREKPGRNDQCPCASGKKYKKCHGR